MNKIKMMAFGAVFAALAMPLVALAQPPLPSSFYGTVKVDGVNVPVGTTVVAYVGGTPIAQATTQDFQGGSVYSINVLGDDPTTTAVEGGTAGAQVFFAIGNTYVATQTGTWATGTNVSLNLTASAAPAATPTAVPPTATTVPPTATAAPQPTATTVPAATATPRPAVATATPAAAAALPKVGDSGPPVGWPVTWMALVVAGIAALGTGIWSVRRARR